MFICVLIFFWSSFSHCWWQCSSLYCVRACPQVRKTLWNLSSPGSSALQTVFPIPSALTSYTAQFLHTLCYSWRVAALVNQFVPFSLINYRCSWKGFFCVAHFDTVQVPQLRNHWLGDNSWKWCFSEGFLVGRKLGLTAGWNCISWRATMTSS